MNNSNDRLDYLIGLAMIDYAKEEAAEYDSIESEMMSFRKRSCLGRYPTIPFTPSSKRIQVKGNGVALSLFIT